MDVSTQRTIKSLLRLLSDPNERIAATIHERLVQYGESTFPYLDEAEQQEPSLGTRLTEVRDSIRFSVLQKEFQRLRSIGGNQVDLEAGTFLIAKSVYPDLDIDHYSQAIDNMAQDVQARLTPLLSTEQAIQLLNDYVFKEKGFRGNRAEYYDVDNSFLNRVIDRRTGIPITLAVLYLLISQRLRLPVVGIGMPGHFMVRVATSSTFLFVDCFNGGTILGEKDCERFLKESGFGFEPQFLEETSNNLILARMLRNLVGIYQKQQELKRIDRLNSLITILERSSEPQLT